MKKSRRKELRVVRKGDSKLVYKLTYSGGIYRISAQSYLFDKVQAEAVDVSDDYLFAVELFDMISNALVMPESLFEIVKGYEPCISLDNAV